MTTRATGTDAEYGIDPVYDDPNGYGARASYYGNGKYPPDWDERRDAVWDRQRHRCGRCGRHKRDMSAIEVHHLRFLSQGGTNDLDNLVGLCGDCHCLMHPGNGDMRGSIAGAPVFPDDDADDRVAVIREPDDDALATDVERVQRDSDADDNRYAVSGATVETSASVAKRASSNLYHLLVEEGYVPRTSAYHRVRVEPSFEGYRGVVTSYSPELSVESDGAASESNLEGDGYDVLYTPDAAKTTVELTDATGETAGERVWFADDESRFRVEKPVTPPPLTLRTAPRYAVDAARYFGRTSLVWGAVPAALVAWRAPSYVPLDGSIPGLLALVLVLGLVLRAPLTLREFLSSPTDRVVDEGAGE